jgi:hypothetical protein
VKLCTPSFDSGNENMLHVRPIDETMLGEILETSRLRQILEHRAMAPIDDCMEGIDHLDETADRKSVV